MRFDRSALIALAGAAVFACACGPSEKARTDTTAANPATPPAAATGTAGGATAATTTDTKKPIVLTGCLQEEKGMLGNYILTQANRTAPDENAVGTAGDKDKNAGNIEQRQINQAARSYRLSGESDQLKGQIGHQIRVRGTRADSADLKDADNDVKQGDLAKVDVESIEMVAASCNAAGAKR